MSKNLSTKERNMSEKSNILIVDDDESIRASLVLIFGKKGYETDTAGTGREAMEKAQERFFNLALIDIRLPDMKGIDLIAPLNQLHPDMVVIMITAYASTETAVRALNEGASAYIRKPLNMDEVLATVGDAVEKQALLMENRRLYKETQLELAERKRAQEALRTSEANFRKVIEKNADAIIVVASDGVVRFANPAAGALFKCKTEKLINTVFGFPMTLGENTEIDIVGRNGETAIAEMRMVKTEWEREKVYLASLRDITKRKQAEEALRESEESYRDLYQNAPNAYFSVSADGLILMCNTAALRLLGYHMKDMVEKNILDLYADTPDNVSKVQEVFKRSKMGESIRDVELQIKHKNGHPIWISLSVEPIRDRDGNVTESRSMVIDISERKRLEAQLRQAQKLEAIGTLAGGIAHDFNNILSATIGYAELAIDDVESGTELQNKLQEIVKAGNRAKRLVKQFLSFSRQAEEEKRPLQISPIVKEVLKLLRASLPTNIEIRHHIEPDTGIIETDSTQIHQVLMNLCINAGYAMHGKGGVLEVSLANVELDSNFTAQHPGIDPSTYLRLTVSDTGQGMTPEVLERLFEPYFTTKEKGEGTGLGLAVVHGIVQSHKGTITVYSNPGKGSTFHVYLPVIEKGISAEIEAAEPLSMGHERILFVDDDQAIVDIGKDMLERLGYTVVASTNSIEALEVFRAQPEQFDLVITNMTMPKMTGDKLAGELMRIRSDIPIVLCTGYSDGITEERAKAMGIRAFVMKPILKHEMAETIKGVLAEGTKRKDYRSHATPDMRDDLQSNAFVR